MYLAITIDVEPDCSPDWTYSAPLSFTGVTGGMAGTLHPFFMKLGVKPTYLINNVVMEDGESAAVLNGLPGDFELGAHLHPEFIEPCKRYSNYAGVKSLDHLCELEPEIEFKKIENITILFEKMFNRRPLSFRAGRFSAGANTITSLARLGYRIDTSVTPCICWNDEPRKHPVDFLNAPSQPYFASRADIARPSGEKAVLEVPVTILQARRILREPKTTWLRPVRSTPREMKSLARTVKDRYGRDAVLNMMFHNVEIMPGLSPYTRTEGDCRKLLRDTEETLKYCLDSGFEPATLARIYDHFAGA